MSALSVISYVASGNIDQAVFVGAVSGNDFKCYQIAATSGKPIGISQNASIYAPGTDADSGYAGVEGKTLRVFGPGEEALLKIGGVVSAGDFLVPDSTGRGVVASLTSTSHQDIGAYALESSSTTNAKIRVQVMRHPARQA